MDRSTLPVQVVIDCADPAALAEFWAGALAPRGYAVPAPPGGFPDWPAFLAAQGVPEERFNSASALEAQGQPRIFFQRVPEPRSGKNRVHLDLLGGGGPAVPLDEQRRRVAAEVERLEALGAVRGEEHAEMGVHWVTMQDPEGNEFCV
ncbi:VOC family protein [Arthrobacter sp. NEB 688]|uniref:VOC family protein n=1 Tax=Arthrobacter sp. NEB 688 TaxID=904039 RepID=UPI001565CD4F|nr:VOC family protein [Arthrobacter sp. NEB 688]QKE85298.1 VOC family protein [Arthrobacter sp. NEB 688]